MSPLFHELNKTEETRLWQLRNRPSTVRRAHGSQAQALRRGSVERQPTLPRLRDMPSAPPSHPIAIAIAIGIGIVRFGDPIAISIPIEKVAYPSDICAWCGGEGQRWPRSPIGYLIRP